MVNQVKVSSKKVITMVMQMARTNNLRKLVKEMLSDAAFTEKHGVKGVYFETGDDKAMYPHIIFSFERIGTGDLWRHDVSLIIDIYTKGTSATKVEDMADDIEDMFNAENLPQTTILPTFYLERRTAVVDEDKTIRHRQIEIVVQNYEL